MRILKQVKVGPYTYKVRFKGELYDEQGQELWGLYNSAQQEIVLSSLARSSDARLGSTFLHEAMHAILEVLNYDIPEQTMGALGVGLYEFLSENGLLAGDE